MCIKCSLTLCNICAVSASPTKEGYSKENKTVGLCKKCNDSNSLEVIVKDEKKSQNKKQTSIFSAFKLKPQKHKTPSSSQSDTKQKQGALSTHTATAATAEKWKSEMAIHLVSEWLTYNIGKNDKINDMKCTVCTDNEKELKQLPNFNDVFIKGSKNYKKSVIEEHAKSGQHLMAMNLFLKSKGTPLIECAKTLSAVNPANTDIITGLERTQRKFKVAYFVAKQQLSMMKYTDILKLENMHGVVDRTGLSN